MRIVIRRHFDCHSCLEAFNHLKYCFSKDGQILGIELKDFDLNNVPQHPEDNPFAQ